MRRLRASTGLRNLVRETRLSPANLVYPLFVCPGKGVRKEIRSMPGVFNLSVDETIKEAEAARSFEAAVEELRCCAGTHFDPEIVKVFMSEPLTFWRGLREHANEPGRATENRVIEADIGFSVLTITGNRLAGNRAV